MNDAEIAAIKEKCAADIRIVMQNLETACPGIITTDLTKYLNDEGNTQLIIDALSAGSKNAANSKEGLGTGAAVGAGASYVLLGVLGVEGFSAAGITSGLAALGLGFGMIGGIIMIPLIIMGAAWWWNSSAKEQKKVKLGEVLNHALRRLYDIKITLFRDENVFAEQIMAVNILLKAFDSLLKNIKQSG